VAEVVPQRQVLESAPAVPASTSQTELDNSIEQIQVMMDLRNRSVQFTRDDTTGSNVIKVVDTESGDTIRQMPAEELLAFMRNLTRMLGTFVDKQT
jgi:flagellar protein FlaG